MKKLLLSLVFILALPVVSRAQLTQTFEDGEDTSDWGATWTAGSVTSTFLDEALGGLNAGSGATPTQSFSRSFKNNTAGIVLTDPYTMNMYVQLNTFDGPEGGQFEIADGDFGASAANLRVNTISPGVYSWQARSTGGWQDIGLDFSLSTPYRVFFTVDPTTFSYSTTVQLVDTAGTVLDSSSLSDLSFAESVINNHQNGTLLFYIQASAGGTEVQVDNINIAGVPEPSTYTLFGCGLLALLLLCKKRRLATSLALVKVKSQGQRL